MQAPLSSTASGQHLRTGPLLGSPSFSPPADGPPLFTQTLLREGTGRRVRASSTSSVMPVAYGPGLAHDAGNLLGALRLYCDLLARPGVLREEHRHYADELQLLSHRSGALIDRLLNPATTKRVGLKPTVPASEQVVVPQVIEQCRGLLNSISRRAVEVVYGAESSVPVPVPRETMERIVVNLTKNAAEASASGGAITLRVSRVQEATTSHRLESRSSGHSRIVLSVEDHGLGMSRSAVKVLLEGHRPSAETPALGENASRGLGLRIVRELVQESGGELRLNTRGGCGTAIEIAWAVAEPVHDGSTAWHGATNNRTNGLQGGVSC